MIVAGLIILAGLVLLVTGYLVRYRGMLRLLAGYERGRLPDEKAFARRMGARLMIAGGLGFTVGGLGFLLPQYSLYLLLLYIACLLIGAMISDLSR